MAGNIGSLLALEELKKRGAVGSGVMQQPQFVDRVNHPWRYPSIQNPDGSTSSHRMAAEVDKKGNWVAFPTIVQMPDGNLKQFENPFDALRYNRTIGNTMEFGSDKDSALNYAKGGYKTDEFKDYAQPLRRFDFEYITDPNNTGEVSKESKSNSRELAIQELKKRGVGFGESVMDIVAEHQRRRKGFGETALSIGSSIAAEPIAGYSGLLAMPLGHERATEVVNNVREKFTYQPRSLEAQQNLQALGSALEPVAEGFEYVSSGLGDTVKDVTGSELLGTAAYTAPAAAAELVRMRMFQPITKLGKQYAFGDIKETPPRFNLQKDAEPKVYNPLAHKQRGTFGGVKAKNANLEMQAAAEELANRGIPPEEIWSQTGWFKGQDGKWRFEIDDSKSKFNFGTRELVNEPLSYRVEHPELMSNYENTNLDLIPINFDPDLPTSGAYTPNADMIFIKGGNVESNTLHEIQHAIQEREGFAKGGSPKEMDSILDNERFESLAKQDDNLTKEFNDLKQKWGKTPASEIPDDVKSRTIELRKEIDKVRARGMKELQNPFSRPSWTETERYSAYKRLYGEAEARLVQERMNYTEAERKAYPPMKHMEDMLAKEGIKMDELIVRNDSGKSMSIEQQMAREELKRRGITAYHGTPHEVDKFSSQYIGTGEGAQAYGHGLYFAENPAVAKDYQTSLSRTGKGYDGAESTAAYYLNMYKDRDRAISILEDSANNPNITDSARQHSLDAIEHLKSGKDFSGNLYKVELDIDPDTEMLDWDKPLSEQPQAIKDLAYKTYGIDEFDIEYAKMSPSKAAYIDSKISGKGSDLYNKIISESGSAAGVSELLNKQGIKGIKYSDQMSRGADGGTSNFVIFDDNLIRIAEKNGVKFEQVEKLAKEKNISKQQALSMLIGGSVGAALWSSGDNKPDRS